MNRANGAPFGLIIRRPQFVTNPWSLLDTLIVSASAISAAISGQPTGVVRVLRALRVIR